MQDPVHISTTNVKARKRCERLLLTVRISPRRDHGFDAIHGRHPPSVEFKHLVSVGICSLEEAQVCVRTVGVHIIDGSVHWEPGG